MLQGMGNVYRILLNYFKELSKIKQTLEKKNCDDSRLLSGLITIAKVFQLSKE